MAELSSFRNEGYENRNLDNFTLYSAESMTLLKRKLLTRGNFDTTFTRKQKGKNFRRKQDTSANSQRPICHGLSIERIRVILATFEKNKSFSRSDVETVFSFEHNDQSSISIVILKSIKLFCNR